MENPTTEDQTAEATQKKDGRKGKTGKKGRTMTFVYSNDLGQTKLRRVKTNAFSVSKAWDELTGSEAPEGEEVITESCRLITTLQGLVHEVKGDQLRKPTYAELEALAGLDKVEPAE